MKFSIFAIGVTVLLLYIYAKRKQQSCPEREELGVSGPQESYRMISIKGTVRNPESWQLHGSRRDALSRFHTLKQPRVVVMEPTGMCFSVMGANLSVDTRQDSELHVLVNSADAQKPLIYSPDLNSQQNYVELDSRTT